MPAALPAPSHPPRVLHSLHWLAAVGVWALCSMTVPAESQSVGDAQRGQKVFQRCYACHDVNPTTSTLQGPHLAGVIGRTAGTLASFPDYSEAMQAAGRGGLVWQTHTLDAFLTDPERLVPGTSMHFLGLRSQQDRADVIAYVQQASP